MYTHGSITQLDLAFSVSAFARFLDSVHVYGRWAWACVGIRTLGYNSSLRLAMSLYRFGHSYSISMNKQIPDLIWSLELQRYRVVFAASQ